MRDMHKRRQSVSMAAAAVVMGISAIAWGDWLILKSNHRLQGTVLVYGDRYLIYVTGEGKKSVPRSAVRQHIKGDALPPDLVDPPGQPADKPGLKWQHKIKPIPGVKRPKEPEPKPQVQAAVIKTSLRSFNQGSRVNSIAISPDGSQVLTGGSNGTVTLWNARTGQRVKTFRSKRAKGRVLAVHWADIDGWKCAMAGIGKDVVVWVLGTGKEIRWYGGHPRFVEAVRYRPGDKTIISACGRELLIRSYSKGLQAAKWPLDASGVTSVDIGADGKWAMTAHRDGRLRRWDLSNPKSRGEIMGLRLPSSSGERPSAVAYTGSCAVGAIGNLLVCQTRKPRKSIPLGGHTAVITAVAAVPGNPGIALSADGDGMIRLWDVDGFRALVTYQSPEKQLTVMAAGADGKSFVTGSADGIARLWAIK